LCGAVRAGENKDDLEIAVVALVWGSVSTI
jgi:hypothetical protein